MNTPLNHVMNYSDLYGVAEELGQLVGARLQDVICERPERYALSFFVGLESGLRWLVIDLTPAQPFILSIKSANPKKQKSPTPVLNFLKAHFKGLTLQSVQVAEKPNRTLKFDFGEGHHWIVKVFPHGQSLELYSEDKHVFFPLRPLEKEPEVSFVEPKPATTWALNEMWARRHLIFAPREETVATKPGVSAREKQIQKLQKSLKSMDEKKENFMAQTKTSIDELERKALEMKSNPQVSGKKLVGTYEEIKKLKRRILEYGEKQNDISRRIHFLQGQKDQPSEAEGKDLSGFAGSKIVIDSQWQFWIGRKAIQNEELLKIAAPHELWFHLRDYPSAHGILRGPKKAEPPPHVLDFCCQILAQLSQKRKSPFLEGQKLDFIVTPRKFVKKQKGSPVGTVLVERETVRRVAYKTVKFDAL